MTKIQRIFSHHLYISFLKLNRSGIRPTSHTKRSSTTLVTFVRVVSRNSNGRIVHLARTYDSFGTRSCDNRTTGPTREGRAARVASGIVEFQIASLDVFVVDTPRHSSNIRTQSIRGGGKSGLHRRSAREKREICMQQEKEVRIGQRR